MKHWQKDILILTASIALAVWLLETHALETLLSSTSRSFVLGTFVAGIFFTSFFTIPIATVALAEISHSHPLLLLALIGACGALLGDIALFVFGRDRLSADFKELFSGRRTRRMMAMFQGRVWRFLTPALGALIIASPLPDELGLAMMGLSKVKIRMLIPISYSMNFLGIVLVGFLASL